MQILRNSGLSLSLLTGILLTGCSTENTKTYEVSVTAIPEEGGTIEPNGGTYSDGEEISLTAVPSNGWQFMRWEGDLLGSDNPGQVIVDDAKDVVAIFATLSEPVTDIDENVYKTVQIGEQVWMAENLKVTRYRNGDAISNVTNSDTWNELDSGAWVYYNNNESNNDVYGKLYNWYAAADSRGVCPEGWRVPTDIDWIALSSHLGGESVAGGKMKATGTQYWQSPNTGATNESGFTALAAGGRDPSGGFDFQGTFAAFWSSTERTSTLAWYYAIDYDNSVLNRYNYTKSLGFSIRCLRD